MNRLIRKLLMVVMAVVLAAGSLYVSPVTAEAGTSEFGDYRKQLGYLTDGTKLQSAYDVLEAAVAAAESSADIKNCGITQDQANTVLYAFLEDNPQYFWFTGAGADEKMNFTVDEASGIVQKMTLEYIFDVSTLEDEKTTFNDALTAAENEIKKVVGSSTSEYVIEKAIHDYLISTVSYYTYADQNQSAYSAIVNKKSVCAGYAKSFKILCDEFGIECHYISGTGYQYYTAKHKENHAWNMVKLDDGQYYMVDVTWDERGDNNPISYGNFNLTSAQFSEMVTPSFEGTSHYTDSEKEYYANLPVCTATTYNYFSVNSQLLSVSDENDAKLATNELTHAAICDCLDNLSDGAYRIFVEDMSSMADVAIKLYGQLTYDDLDQLGLTDGTVNAGYTYSGHELILVIKNIPGVNGVERSSGSGRFETATKTADYLKEAKQINKFEAVIVAYSHNSADALAGSYLAAVTGAPILLVYKTAEHSGTQATLKYIRENLTVGGKIYVLGGEGVINADVYAELKSISPNIERLAGAGRWETNMKILEAAAQYSTDDTVLLCDGWNFADALSASALGLPIVLVNSKSETASLTAAQLEYLQAKGFSKVYIIGGTSAVPDSVKTTVENLLGVTANRISGKNRYETSMKIASTEAFFSTEPTTITIATGVNFPDGLTGGPLAYAYKSPLILIHSSNTDWNSYAKTYVADNSISNAVVFGGTSTLSDEIVNYVMGRDN